MHIKFQEIKLKVYTEIASTLKKFLLKKGKNTSLLLNIVIKIALKLRR